MIESLEWLLDADICKLVWLGVGGSGGLTVEDVIARSDGRSGVLMTKPHKPHPFVDRGCSAFIEIHV